MATQNLGSALLGGFSTALGLSNQRARNESSAVMDAYRMAATGMQVAKNEETLARREWNELSSRPGFQSIKSNTGDPDSFYYDATGKLFGENSASFLPQLESNEVLMQYRQGDKQLRAKGINGIRPLGRKNEDGEDLFAVEIVRQDGVVAPKTVNGTDNKDDVVREFTKGELDNYLNISINDLAARAGMNIGQGRNYAALGNQMLQIGGARVANNMATTDNGMALQFFDVYKNAPPETQAQILGEFGIDAEALTAQQSDSSMDGETGAASDDLMNRTAVINSRLQAAREASYGQGRNAAAKKANTVRPIKEELDAALEEFPEIAPLVSQVEEIRKGPAGRGRSDKISKLERQIKTKKEEIMKTLPSVDVDSATPPAADDGVTATDGTKVPVSTDQLAAALRDRLLKPSNEDIGKMRDILTRSGVSSVNQVPEALRQGNMLTEDVVRLAAIIAAEESAMAGDSPAANPGTRFFEVLSYFGVMPDKDRRELENKEAKTRTSQTGQEIDLLGKQITEVKDVADIRRESYNAVFDNNGSVKDEDEQDLTKVITNTKALFDRAAVDPRGRVGRTAAREAPKQMVIYLQALASNEGAASWGDWFSSWFQSDTKAILGDPRKHIKYRTELVRGADGGMTPVIKSLVFVNARNQRQNYEIPISELEDELGMQELEFLTSQLEEFKED